MVHVKRIKGNVSQKRLQTLQRKKQQKRQGIISEPLIKHSIEGKWYEYADADRSDDANEADKEQLSKVEEKATYLLSRDIDVHNQLESKRNASEAGWLNTVIVQGTAGDRISAMQMFIQRSPVHALSHLNTLVSRVQKKNPREAFSILSVLKELFINEILPPTRKLIPLSKRPVCELEKQLEKGEKAAERRLIMWKFESDLKKLYENFVMALESLSNGMVVNVCAEACRAALDLLIERPEQEQRLLTLLVNKLGHPNRKFASRLVGYLMKLTQKQPNMRPVVVKEVERLIYRKNISCRAQLYAVTFLAQMQLNAGDVELAASLLTIYIGLFRILIAKQKIDDKIISALLTATNRAFPYAKNEAERLTKEIDTLYKVLHQSNFNTALQTLKLLHQLLVTSEGISDRFYSAFYRKLLDVEHSAKQQSQLFGLLYKTLKNDSETQRVIAFIKRMLQLSVNRSAAFAAATLVVISKLIEERPSLLLVSKSANRMIDAATVKMERIDLWDEDDEEERYFDVPDPQPSAVKNSTAKAKQLTDEVEQKPDLNEVSKSSGKGGWVHRDNIVLRAQSSHYDRSVRNPLFAHAETSIASELLELRKHYHPTVAIFAANLLDGTPIRYDGDPLVDFTAIRFLDRFVYRNPKSNKSKKSSDDNNEQKKLNVFKRRSYDPRGVKKLAVTSEEYMNKKRNEIPVDERYLHRFAVLKPKVKTEATSKEGRKKGDFEDDFDDVESVNSDEFNLLLERFEPGEKNDVFDVNFAKEFGVEKKRKKKKTTEKRKAQSDESDGEGEEGADDLEGGDDDLEDDEQLEGGEGASDEEMLGDEDDEGSLESAEDEEGSDDEEYDGIIEGEEGDSDFEDALSFKKQLASGNLDSDSDDDYAQKFDFVGDATKSADKFADMMDEDDVNERKKRSKRKTKKPRSFKKRRTR